MAWSQGGHPTVQKRDNWVVRVDGIDTESGHIRAGIGGVRVGRLERADVARWFDQLAPEGRFSRRSIQTRRRCCGPRSPMPSRSASCAEARQRGPMGRWVDQVTAA